MQIVEIWQTLDRQLTDLLYLLKTFIIQRGWSCHHTCGMICMSHNMHVTMSSGHLQESSWCALLVKTKQIKQLYLLYYNMCYWSLAVAVYYCSLDWFDVINSQMTWCHPLLNFESRASQTIFNVNDRCFIFKYTSGYTKYKAAPFPVLSVWHASSWLQSGDFPSKTSLSCRECLLMSW